MHFSPGDANCYDIYTAAENARDGANGGARSNSTDVYFNANGGSAENNPMAGHANGADIHPINRQFIVWKRIAEKSCPFENTFL